MTKYTRVFKASEFDLYRSGWVADLSGPGESNPDCYWFFLSRQQAEEFLRQIDDGMSTAEAVYAVLEMMADDGGNTDHD